MKSQNNISMKHLLILVWAFLALIANISASSLNTATTAKCEITEKLTTLPGKGWDVVRNQEMKQICLDTYLDCKKTEDGRNLIPDRDLDDKEDEFVAHILDVPSRNLIGSFSPENIRNASKTSEFMDDIHTIALIDESKCSPTDEFKEIFRKAIVALEVNGSNVAAAEKFLEKVVRNYGTHLTVNITVGESRHLLPEILSRVIMPLLDLISKTSFPEANSNSLENLKSSLRKVIQKYYAYNSHEGCADPTSPYFDPNANIHREEGCVGFPRSNNTFGGVFQACRPSAVEFGDLCTTLAHKNLLTDDLSCPEGYSAVFLRTGHKTEQNCSTECTVAAATGQTLCEPKCFTRSAMYTAYWCAGPANNSGFGFGGLYSSLQANPITGQMSCPTYFVAVDLLQDLHVCVSNDYSSDQYTDRIFGGFFSCSSGNPLSSKVLYERDIDDYYPHSCPPGFTQHTATIDDECLINYCSQGQYGGRGVRHFPIVLPPFEKYADADFLKSELSNGSSLARPEVVNFGKICGIVIFCAVLIILFAFLVGFAMNFRKLLVTVRLAPEQDFGSAISDDCEDKTELLKI